MGILIADIEAPTVAVGAEVQFKILVFSHQLCGIQAEEERNATIVDSHTNGGFVIGFHLRVEGNAMLFAFNLQLGTSDLNTSCYRPLGLGANDVGRIDFLAALTCIEQAVSTMEKTLKTLRLQRADAELQKEYGQ